MDCRYVSAVFVLVLALTVALPVAHAQDSGRERALTAGSGVDKEEVDAAVKKACMWLRARQHSDGHWQSADATCRSNDPMKKLYIDASAFVLFALLKGGIDPDHSNIEKGFRYLYSKKNRLNGVYEAAAMILALAARYQPPEEPDEQEVKKELKKEDLTKTSLFEPPEKKHENRFKKAPKKLKNWLVDLVKWLIKKQNPRGGWGYGHTLLFTDASNTQYGVLALHAATRCGINIPARHFVPLAKYMLKHQEKEGPEVEPFPVPVADFEIRKLKELEKEFLDNLLKHVQTAREQGEEITAEKLKELGTSVPKIEDPYKKFGVEPRPMEARGWGYTPMIVYRNVPADDVYHRTTGSMTCSGIAALCIAKANMEGKARGKFLKLLNKGIRDGCAWIANNFTVTENASSPEWHYYYLYGLERAGILALVPQFGPNNWYAEGAKYLLAQQRGDGSWPGELGNKDRQVGQQKMHGANLDPMINTCFAILFLRKATAPVIKVPEAIYTGSDLFGPKKSDDE